VCICACRLVCKPAGTTFKQKLKDSGVYGQVDVIFDPVGGALSEPALRALGWGGRFLVIGFAAGGDTPKDAIPVVPLNLALLNERAILGVFWGVSSGLGLSSSGGLHRILCGCSSLGFDSCCGLDLFDVCAIQSNRRS
jgi:threonine dehydrogenase-like Zn-dependent dehydrogenase